MNDNTSLDDSPVRMSAIHEVDRSVGVSNNISFTQRHLGPLLAAALGCVFVIMQSSVIGSWGGTAMFCLSLGVPFLAGSYLIGTTQVPQTRGPGYVTLMEHAGVGLCFVGIVLTFWRLSSLFGVSFMCGSVISGLLYANYIGHMRKLHVAGAQVDSNDTPTKLNAKNS